MPDNSPFCYPKFKRKFERYFQIGTYPEINFTFENNDYCIRADIEQFFLEEISETDTNMSRQIGKYSSLDELFNNGMIENRHICDVWKKLNFHDYEEEYIFDYAFNDWVYVKNHNLYGIVREIYSQTNPTTYLVVPEHIDIINHDKSDEIICTAYELEYDERESSIKELREAFASYLDRITSPIILTNQK